MKVKTVIITLLVLVLSLQAVFFVTFPQTKENHSRSDLVIVFPGKDNRIGAGFKLAQDGLAPNIAISGVGMARITALADKFGYTGGGVRLLSGANSRSTFEDALAMKNIVQQHQFKSVLLVTSAYHMPRAFLLARMALAGTGTKLNYFSIPDPPLVDGKNPVIAKNKIMIGEMMKLWGSGVELSWYLVTGTLSRDIPILKKISFFMRERIF